MKNKIGIIVIIIGLLHTLLGIVKFSDIFAEMILEGFFDSGMGAERGWAVWFTVTGIVFVLLGLAIKQIEHQKMTIPKVLGWGLLFMALCGGLMIPVSGFWALLLPAGLIISPK